MSVTGHSYSTQNSNDERIPTIFSQLLDYRNKPKNQTKTDAVELIKVASGCVSCPLYKKTISSTTCNKCKFASGTSFKQNESFIKCSYKSSVLIKQAYADSAAIQPIKWDVGGLQTKENLKQVQNEIKDHVIEELKYAANRIGVKLAKEHYDGFCDLIKKERLKGKLLEKAAYKFVSKIETRLAPQMHRNLGGKLDNVFEAVTKNTHHIVSGTSSPNVGDNERANSGKYMGSETNPNSIWDSKAIDRLAQKKTNDELILEAKAKDNEIKQSMKQRYWKALEEKLAGKDMISHARVHATSTESKVAFNSNLPENAMSIFGEHKEFDNIPVQTDGEKLAEQKEKRENKKAISKREWNQIKKTSKAKSDNWLFQ